VRRVPEAVGVHAAAIARRRTYIPAMQIVWFGTRAWRKRAMVQEKEKNDTPQPRAVWSYLTIILYYNMLLWLTLQYHINPFAFYGRRASGQGRGGGREREREISVDNETESSSGNQISVRTRAVYCGSCLATPGGRTRKFRLSVKRSDRFQKLLFAIMCNIITN